MNKKLPLALTNPFLKENLRQAAIHNAAISSTAVEGVFIKESSLRKSTAKAASKHSPTS